jgi:hypothetical protein
MFHKNIKLIIAALLIATLEFGNLQKVTLETEFFILVFWIFIFLYFQKRIYSISFLN